jgi:hypothetical protein
MVISLSVNFAVALRIHRGTRVLTQGSCAGLTRGRRSVVFSPYRPKPARRGRTLHFEQAPCLGRVGVIVPLQARFPTSVITGPARLLQAGFCLGHNGANVPCQADFQLRS